MIAHCIDATTVCADELTVGDVVQHFTSDIWMVITEPEFTSQGISFEVLCLDVETLPNTQTVCFAPEWKFVLLDHRALMAA